MGVALGTLAAILSRLPSVSLVTSGLQVYYPGHDANILGATAWTAKTYATGAYIISQARYGLYQCSTGGTSTAAPSFYSGPSAVADAGGTAFWQFKPFVMGYDSTLTHQTALDALGFGGPYGSSINPQWDSNGNLNWQQVGGNSGLAVMPSGIAATTKTVSFVYDFGSQPYPSNILQSLFQLSPGDLILSPDGSVDGATAKTVSSYGGKHLITIIAQNSTVDTYIDNRKIKSYYPKTAIPTFSDPVYIAFDSRGHVGLRLQTDICFYNRAITPAEIAQNLAFVQAKASLYGITGIGVDTIAQTAPILSVAGDSITRGAGATTLERSWPNQMIGIYAGNNRNRINISGLDGFTLGGETGQATADDDDLIHYTASTSRLKLLALGTNDIVNYTGSQTANANAVASTTMAGRITTARTNGATKVVVHTLLYRVESASTATYDSYNTTLKSGTQDATIDFATLFWNTTAISFGYLHDGVHPTDIGYAHMAMLAAPVLVAVGITNPGVPVWPVPANASAPSLPATSTVASGALALTNGTATGTGNTYKYEWVRSLALGLPPWTQNTAYALGTKVCSDGFIWNCTQAGTSATTGTAGFQLGHFNATITADGTCNWTRLEAVYVGVAGSGASPNVLSTTATYTPVAGDIGYSIACLITATNSFGFAMGATRFCKITS
jgi:lysophospholipase L1-like esterase